MNNIGVGETVAYQDDFEGPWKFGRVVGGATAFGVSELLIGTDQGVEDVVERAATIRITGVFHEEV